MKKTKDTHTTEYTNTIPNTPFRFIKAMSKPHILFAYGAFIVVTFATIFSNLNPYILKKVVDGVSESASHGALVELITFWAMVYVLLTALSFLCWRLSGFIGAEWLTRTDQTAFERLYRYVSHHSHQYFSDRFAGALSNKISNAADGSEHMLERFLWGWYPEILTLGVGIILFYTVDFYIALGFCGVLFILFFMNLFLIKRRKPYIVSYAQSSSRLRGEGVDLLTNIAAARQYARREYEMERLGNVATDKRIKDVRQTRMGEWSSVLNNIVVVLTIAAIFAYVIVLFKAGSVTSGDVVLSITVMGRMTRIMVFLGNMMNSFIRLYGEIEEGLEVVLEPHGIKDVPGAEALTVGQGAIAWKKVSFMYHNDAVFNDFDLTIQPGERIGLVGPSGAGKTTFVSLLLRQHDIQGGEILIDGQNIANVTQDSLRRAIAIVPQEPLLFHRSIRENIAYGKPGATEEEIIAVAKKAQAHDFIAAIPQGYDTLVGERGVKLSGGQRQRVAIARAMLKNAPILVLDEATSALDSESEVAIQKALHELMEGKTVIAIAHRLSTLREMDRILVLENGKIVEDGPHAVLSRADNTYARLWEHQAGGFLQE